MGKGGPSLWRGGEERGGLHLAGEGVFQVLVGEMGVGVHREGSEGGGERGGGERGGFWY